MRIVLAFRVLVFPVEKWNSNIKLSVDGTGYNELIKVSWRGIDGGTSQGRLWDRGWILAGPWFEYIQVIRAGLVREFQMRKLQKPKCRGDQVGVACPLY